MRRVIDDSTISVNGKQIKIVSNRDPLQLPWGEMVRLLLPKICPVILIGKRACSKPADRWILPSSSSMRSIFT